MRKSNGTGWNSNGILEMLGAKLTERMIRKVGCMRVERFPENGNKTFIALLFKRK